MAQNAFELHVSGPAGTRVIPIGEQSLRIGRGPDNELPLADDKVLSRNHCVIEYRNGTHYIRDLESRHGTWTKGRRLKIHRLSQGDVILAGRSKLVFRLPGSKPPRAGERAPERSPQSANKSGVRRGKGHPRDSQRRRTPSQRGPKHDDEAPRPDPGRPDPGRPDPGRPDPNKTTIRSRPIRVSDKGLNRETRTRQRRPQTSPAPDRYAKRRNRELRRERPPPRQPPPEERQPPPEEPQPEAHRDEEPSYSDYNAAPPELEQEDQFVDDVDSARERALNEATAELNEPLRTATPAEPPRRRKTPPRPFPDEGLFEQDDPGAASSIIVPADESIALATVPSEKPPFPKGWPGGLAPRDGNNPAQQILLDARRRSASDIHIMPGLPITFRIHGELRQLGALLNEDQVNSVLRAVTTDDQLTYFHHTGDYDYSYAFEGGGRFRTNICRHRLGNALSFRTIKNTIGKLEELGIPEAAERLTTYAQGLVLITGPMGTGKTTTMTALVQLVNETRPDHIITIEDPIEFLLKGARCHVSQRELGVHTDSFDNALKAALREDPDIIVIGDLRDYETTSLAISAAETGHLVFASMHAMNATKSLDKLIDMFPASEQTAVRQMVSESLRGILCQKLVPSVDGTRVAAVELVFNSVAIGNIIRENKMASLRNAMQLGRSLGMRTLDMSLQALIEDQRIMPSAALDFAENPEGFRHLLPQEEDEYYDGDD